MSANKIDAVTHVTHRMCFGRLDLMIQKRVLHDNHAFISGKSFSLAGGDGFRGAHSPQRGIASNLGTRRLDVRRILCT